MMINHNKINCFQEVPVKEIVAFKKNAGSGTEGFYSMYLGGLFSIKTNIYTINLHSLINIGPKTNTNSSLILSKT